MSLQLRRSPARLKAAPFLKWARSLATIAVSCIISVAHAQVPIPVEYDKVIQYRSPTVEFGAEGFGEKIDLASGSVEIIQVDVDLPGNDSLPVRLARRFLPADKYAGGFAGGVFDLDLPYAHGVFSYRNGQPWGWTVPGVGADSYRRCSRFAAPPDISFQGGIYTPAEYWQGNSVYMPGLGDQEMLHASTRRPSDGQDYPLSLKNGAAIRCVLLDQQADAPYRGEGFEVVMPDGTIYTLNHMILRDQKTIQKRFASPGGPAASPKEGTHSDGVRPNVAVNFILPRKEVRLYPTKVQDRFGNVVHYNWNSSDLTSIVASDGRQIDFAYSSDPTARVVATAGTRTWTYGQAGSVEHVILPDESKWTYDLYALRNYVPLSTPDGCSTPGVSGSPPAGSITAPGGGKATYTFANVLMARSWVPYECFFDEATYEPSYLMEPVYFYRVAITGKTVTGPGLSNALTWSFVYGPASGCTMSTLWIPCTSSSPTTRTVMVTDPAQVATRYTYGNRYASNEGLLLRKQHGWNGSTALRTEEYEYGDANAAPYGAYDGSSVRLRGDTVMTTRRKPLRKVTTSQSNRTFVWQVASDCNGAPYCFDSHARPTKVLKMSTP